ncbi:anthranilate synthase component II [Bacteroidota bacterium]
MSKKILILDNYDSFTYNLVQQIKELSTLSYDVVRNDVITVEETDQYDAFILSPGPGLPKDSGILLDLIKRQMERKPIFGVCLGMQAISEVMGGTLFNLKKPLHGVSTEIELQPDLMFKDMPSKTNVGRYHSWAVKADSLPAELLITAYDKDEVPMAIRHKNHPVSAVQFHPESILTDNGATIIQNFLKQV